MTSSSEQDPLGIKGTILAEKYRIDDVVGEGGFSIVYRAEHLIWQQPVAIKCFRILAQAPIEKRDELLDSFIQEGRLLASLSSRSAAIVQARDIGKFTTADGQWIPYMVLEWLDGQPLENVLFEERVAGMPARRLHEAMALLEPVIIALEIAHAKNIAHRDIKPANIFVIGDPRSPSPFTKVLDFGIAKVMANASDASSLARTGTEITAFTPNYGAPEQFSRSYGATGPWTDVFAMALILVEILRGGVPWLDTSDVIQFAIAACDPVRRPTPRNFGIGVSAEVEAVFNKALAVAPGGRFASMGQFWAALHQAVHQGNTWTPGATSGIWPAVIPPAQPAPAPAPYVPAAPMHSNKGLSRPPPAGTIPIFAPPPPPNFAAHLQVATPMAKPSTRPNYGAAPRRSSSVGLIVALVAIAVLGAVGILLYKLLASTEAPSTNSSGAVPSSAPPSGSPATTPATTRPTK